MSKTLRIYTQRSLKGLFRFRKSSRLRYIPLLASLCVGIPLLAGLALDLGAEAQLAALSGLVILYLPAEKDLGSRIRILLWSSLGFMASYGTGLVFSYSPLISSLVFGLYSMLIHRIILLLEMRPPGSFFFIMMAAIASCRPYEPAMISEKMAWVALGCLLACVLALIFSLTGSASFGPGSGFLYKTPDIRSEERGYREALIMGLLMFASMWSAHLLRLGNPYWVPVSCLAVMQGASLFHIWNRLIQRMLGTLAGLGLGWLLLSLLQTPLPMVLGITLLQLLVEVLIVRHYALAVVFITPLTLLLAEGAPGGVADPDALLLLRLTDIALGCFLGLLGGWLLHNERFRRRYG